MADNKQSPPQAGPSLTRRFSRNPTTSVAVSGVSDTLMVPSTMGSVDPVLRVAEDIQHESPRVAYLCRFNAFEKAHRVDQNSNGRGVRTFKTSLLQRLERDNGSSLASRVKESDAREIASYYSQYYENYIKGDRADRAQLGKACKTAGVLFEVLCSVNKNENVKEVPPEIIAAARDVEQKTEIYAPYNILPLDAGGASQSTMQLDEVKAAVAALSNTRGLNWPDRQATGDFDIFGWLRAMFGFQKDSVRNQREHLILLLSNNHVRLEPKPEPLNKLDDRAVNAVMTKLFKNYRTWCMILGRKHRLRLPRNEQEMQQRKILYMGLFLLIWGEASNIRLLPECLCYIFHHMAMELHDIMSPNPNVVIGENVMPSYGGGDKAFLRKVVNPIYHVIEKEAMKSRNGKAPNSAWCNYNVLNEYFWSPDCFSLGWPIRYDGEFFKSPGYITRLTLRCLSSLGCLSSRRLGRRRASG